MQFVFLVYDKNGELLLYLNSCSEIYYILDAVIQCGYMCVGLYDNVTLNGSSVFSNCAESLVMFSNMVKIICFEQRRSELHKQNNHTKYVSLSSFLCVSVCEVSLKDFDKRQ